MHSSRFAGLLVVVSLASCSTATTSTDDTGATDAGADVGACASCDDGLFCNGVETCAGGHCGAGTSPCTASQTCDEAMDRCTGACTMPDADHDGVPSIACGGTDCDDTNPNVHPGIIETCDTLNVDEDCDPTTYGAHDADGDGHDSSMCCNGTPGTPGAHCGDDCDDLHIDVFLGASETCNHRDDDCDAEIDEMLATNDYYADCDGDGFGGTVVDPSCAIPTSAPSCAGGVWVTTAGDCDDARMTAHPGATEICNGYDDDCNGVSDDPAIVDPACVAANPIGAAHATIACISGACGLGPCATGYANCDAMSANGCETDTTTDHDHCGSCMTSCGAAAVCGAGACTPLVDIDAGSAHTCALYQTGLAVCWGRNGEGQLGDGSRTMRTSAVPVMGGIAFQFLEAGGYRIETDLGLVDQAHTCGAQDAGVYCWGRGNEGQLGNNATASSAVPVVVSNLPVTTPLDTGPPHFLAISAGGMLSAAVQIQPRLSRPIWTAWWWGQDSISTHLFPFRASPIGDVERVGAGVRHVCFTSGDDGGVYCLGSNGAGELGNAAAGAGSDTLVRSTWTPSGYWASQVAAGGISGSGRLPSGQLQTSSSVTCSRGGIYPNDGTVYCWGSAGEGQLGNGPSLLAGTPVSGFDDAIDISVGGRHACAVRMGGAVVCWGSNYYGQLGNGGGADANVPVSVTGLGPAVSVTAGGEHSCAVLVDGSAWCWGRNDFGQLGNGTTTDSSVPVRVQGT